MNAKSPVCGDWGVQDLFYAVIRSKQIIALAVWSPIAICLLIFIASAICDLLKKYQKSTRKINPAWRLGVWKTLIMW